MSENRSSLIRALLAISLMLFVIGFVVHKSGAIEPYKVTKMVDGKAQEKDAYRFNAGKIGTYLKSVISPVTGSKALSEE
jgi:hypothetical protein